MQSSETRVENILGNHKFKIELDFKEVIQVQSVLQAVIDFSNDEYSKKVLANIINQFDIQIENFKIKN